MPIIEAHVISLLRLKGDYLYHREGQELEFKEQFNFAGLADYYRDFAAFANNRGGYIIFGVEDSPRIPSGMSESSREQFEKIDPQMISGHLLDIFAPDILWEQTIVELYGTSFGVFRVHQAKYKPVIAKKDEGRDHIITNGEIYYRYGGRTQRIQYAELENIIANRIDQINCQWIDLVQKIGNAHPQNVAILDTENAIIQKDNSQILVMDEALLEKLRFIKEGEFSEIAGAPTLKLIGDVVPVSQVEIVQKVKENRLARYPFSAMQLAAEVQRILPTASKDRVWKAIKANDLKTNPGYSVYNFRSKSHEDEFERSGHVPNGTPSIYNQAALDFLLNVLK